MIIARMNAMNTPTKACTRCKREFPVTLEYFPKAAGYIGSWCRECKNAQAYDYHQRKTADKRAAKEQQKLADLALSNQGLKRCSKCKIIYPATAEYFYHADRWQDGFNIHCKHCLYRKKRSLATIERIQCKLLRSRLIDRGLRFCPKCEEIKPNTDEYYYASSTSLGSWCKRCENAKNRINSFGAYGKAKAAGKIDYEKRRADSRDWKRRNRHKTRLEWHIYQSRKAELPANFKPIDWQRALNYFNGCCAVCDRQLNDLLGDYPAQADHWIPMSNPDCPGTVPTNIVPLCGQRGGCNQLKGTKHPREWLIERYGKRRALQILDRIDTYFRSLTE
jgi:hypothetical protein